MPESLKTRLMRLGFNLFPAYRGMARGSITSPRISARSAAG